MALTQQEILETRKRLGIPEGGVSAPPVSSAAQNVARRRQLAADYDAKQAEPKTFLGMKQGKESLPARAAGFIKDKIQERGQRLGETFAAPIDPKAKATALAGETAGLIFNDIAGKIFEKGIQAIPEPIRNRTMETINKVADAATNNPKLREGLNVINQGWDAWKQYEQTNPLEAEQVRSVINILSAVPVGGTAKATATATKSAVDTGIDVARTATKAVGESVDNIAAKSGQLIDNVVPQATKVVKDIVPTRGEMISGQITKALDLTQGDVSNIKLSTKNDVGTWISDKNLIGGNKKETVAKIKELTDTQYKAVRSEIAKVPTVYKSASVPRVKESLSMLSDDLKGVLGQEKAVSEVNALLKKKTYKLEDVQRVKELLDDQFDLYKATGDVKAGQTKAGLANVRTELKTFIEKEVKDNTGADIRGMNNDVATGKSIQRLAEKRSTRDFTRANISLSDLGAFGGGSILGTPLLGAAAFVVKRIIETPTMRLKFAQFLKSLPKKEVEIIKNTLLKGEVPEQINAFEKVNNFLKDRAGLTMKEIKEIDSLTKDEMIDAIDYIRLKKPFDAKMEQSIGDLTEKFGIQYKDMNKISDAFENLVETTKTKDVGGKIVKTSPAVGETVSKIDDFLIQEAKKYKSAEEFVNNYDYQKVAKSLQTQYGKDVYFAKVSDITQIEPKLSEDILNKYRQEFKDGKSKNWSVLVHEGNKTPFNAADANHRLQVLKENNVKYVPIKPDYKSGAVPLSDALSPEEYALNVIKNESQLTDIWNKANKK